MKELEDLLQHHGVKGMKWGVIKKAGKAISNSTPAMVAKSTARELGWQAKVAKSTRNKLSTQEMQNIGNRIRNENDFKKLAFHPLTGGRQDRKDYLNRSKLTDQELNDRVNNLRAKENLRRQSIKALDTQKKILEFAAPLAMAKYVNGNVTSKDILDAMQKNKKSSQDLQTKAVQKFITNKMG